jgi:hypothetical protein
MEVVPPMVTELLTIRAALTWVRILEKARLD